MNSVIWSIDLLIASGSFSWLPCLLAFLSILSAWLSRIQQGEPAFLPASLPLNSVGVWCYKNRWGRATLSVPWDCNREKREVCFCSCPLQTGSSLIGRVCAFYTSVFFFFPSNPYYRFANDKLSCAGFSELGCHVGQSLLAWKQDLPPSVECLGN